MNEKKNQSCHLTDILGHQSFYIGTWNERNNRRRVIQYTDNLSPL